MNKRTRFLIVLAVIGVSFAFLWPTIRWYFIVPQDQKTLALGSREQIRDYSSKMASIDLEELKKTAASGSEDPVGDKFAFLVKAAKKRYKDEKKALPAAWTVKSVFGAFFSEKEVFDEIESRYRTNILDLKNLHGNAVQLGLDLSGGLSVVIEANLDSVKARLGHELSAAEKDDSMKRATEVLNSRIDKFGLTEPVIRQQGENQIYVEIPGAADPERIKSIIMGKGRLAFHIVDDEATTKFTDYIAKNPLGLDGNGQPTDKTILPAGKVVRKFYQKDKYGIDEFTGRYLVIADEPGLDGNRITSAVVSRDSITGQPDCNFVLDKEGGDIFYKLTSANVDKTLAVVLDDRIKAGARIQEPIRESVRMTGFNQEEAQNLALILRTAALPVELEPVSQQAIGASLGEDAIKQGQLAIIFGLLLVFIFMFMYYKGAGINAIVAQVLNMYIMIAVLSAFNLTLTLPSIAGFVLTIGMAIDANVIVFERIKEELRLGKGRKASIEAGFNKAFWAIFDSNLTTIIAALFLAQLGSGPIQGFAISLAIGNITSLFTALFVSHLIFDFGTDVLKQKSTSISWRIK